VFHLLHGTGFYEIVLRKGGERLDDFGGDIIPYLIAQGASVYGFKLVRATGGISETIRSLLYDENWN
jgi:hypothetical protein